MDLEANISQPIAEHTTWDAIIAGAGPSGSLTALLLARQGFKVLLLEKAAFPRMKVCGCCLSGLGVSILKSPDLQSVLIDANAVPLKMLELRSPSSSSRFMLQGGMAVSREQLDTSLVQSAMRAGASFMPKTLARPGPLAGGESCISVLRAGISSPLHARVLIWAAGLSDAGKMGGGEPWIKIEDGSPIGVGCLIDSPEPGFGTGSIYMATSAKGYAGMVLLRDGRMNIGACLRIPKDGSRPDIPQSVMQIIEDCGLPLPANLSEVQWHGTPPLTRTAQKISAERIFALGDAAGYVEPFTGEGMSWALLAAQTLSPIAASAIQRWDNRLISSWNNAFAQNVRSRQQVCRAISFILKRKGLFNLGMGVLNNFHGIGDALLRKTSHNASSGIT